MSLTGTEGKLETIPTRNFYSVIPSWEEKLERLTRQGQSSQSHKKVLALPEFPKQQMAFDYADDGIGLWVFAFEDLSMPPGRRKYVSATLDDFWAFYYPLSEKARRAGDPALATCSYYEVIRETAPCNLYFDLEYSLENNLNQEKDGDRMVDTLLALCFEVLAPIIDRRPTTAEVIELQATQPGLKFSRHLVVRLLDACFHDFAAAGNFVAHIIGKIKERSHQPEYAELWVETEDQGPVLFIDRGVYTKNRNFRLFRSTKLGKGRPLLPHESRSFYPWTRRGEPGQHEKELFRASLVGYVAPGQTQVLQWVGPGKEVVPARVARPPGDVQERAESPYPALDAWLLRLVGRWGSPPGIKSVLTFRDSHSLLFNIRGNRYCHRINREHKSNSVYWRADLGQHLLEQHCFDPDCRTFRSNAFPFPPYLLQPHEAIPDEDLLALEADWPLEPS